MKSNSHDYLKYWRVIRQYTKVRYGLSQADLDVLLFLYSEGYFGKDKFKEFSQLISWEVKRFDRLLRDGWIENFRAGRRGAVKGLYTLTFKSKKMIAGIYNKLSGEEIPETICNNPMFKKNVRFTDKVYRNMIRAMNAETKQNKLRGQAPRPVPEL
jgi:hypothetical protein